MMCAERTMPYCCAGPADERWTDLHVCIWFTTPAHACTPRHSFASAAHLAPPHVHLCVYCACLLPACSAAPLPAAALAQPLRSRLVPPYDHPSLALTVACKRTAEPEWTRRGGAGGGWDGTWTLATGTWHSLFLPYEQAVVTNWTCSGMFSNAVEPHITFRIRDSPLLKGFIAHSETQDFPLHAPLNVNFISAGYGDTVHYELACITALCAKPFTIPPISGALFLAFFISQDALVERAFCCTIA